MSVPIVYLDTSEIRPGGLHELKAAIQELAAFVEANEPRLLAYNVYFTDDEQRMTVMHSHIDSAALAFHMQVAGPQFARFAPLVRLLSIDVYGSVGGDVLERLREKARLLGGAPVQVHAHHAGFSRS